MPYSTPFVRWGNLFPGSGAVEIFFVDFAVLGVGIRRFYKLGSGSLTSICVACLGSGPFDAAILRPLRQSRAILYFI